MYSVIYLTLLGTSYAVHKYNSNQIPQDSKQEDVMKALTTIMGVIAPATAFAASGAGEEGSGVFIWIFLGFFAVIVVGQLIPAVMLVTGLVKGLLAKTEVKTEVK
jgi:hypothetical protein